MTACCRRVSRRWLPAGHRSPPATISALRPDSVTGAGQDELFHCAEEFTHPLAIHRVTTVGVTDQHPNLLQSGGVELDYLALHTESPHRVCLPAWGRRKVADQVQSQLAAESLGYCIQVGRRRDRDRKSFRHSVHSAGLTSLSLTHRSLGNHHLTSQNSLALGACRDLQSEPGSSCLGRDSPMDRLSHRRGFAAALAGVGVLLASAACGSDDPEPLPPPSTSSSATSTSPAPAETEDTGGPPSGWKEDFSNRQLRAYQAALASLERYDRGAGPIYAEGKDTPAARRFFRSNDLEPQKRIELIQGIERAGIHEVRAAEPLWTKVKSVTLRPDGTGTVLITQCVDYTRLRWEHDNGRPVKGLKPKTLVTPLTVQMDKPNAESEWLYANSQVSGKHSCAG